MFDHPSTLGIFPYKPRADYGTLERFSKGLIVGSGCLGGPVLQPLLHGNVEAATRVAQRIQDIMGRDSFYIELMRHGLPEQARTNPQLIDIAKRIGAPIFATQDCLVGDTIVSTEHGPKRIDQIRIGEMVYSDKGVLRTVEHVFKRNLRPEDDGVYRVKSFAGTYAFEATGNHKILTAQKLSANKPMSESNMEIRWTKVKDLTKDHFLLVPKIERHKNNAINIIDLTDICDIKNFTGLYQPPNTTKIIDGHYVSYHQSNCATKVMIPTILNVDEELLFILGFFIANGNTDRYSYKISMSGHVDKIHILKRISAYFEKFGLNPKLNIMENGASLDFSSRIFSQFFSRLCGSGAGNKKFPSLGGYTHWSETQVLTIAEGWFAGDGCDAANGTFSVTSTSKELIFDFILRMNQLGFPLAAAFEDNLNHENWAPAWTISTSGTRRKALMTMLRSHEVCQEELVKNSKPRFNELNDYWAVKLLEVSRVKRDELVYDLTVEEDHSYIANGYAVSNSHYTHKEDSHSHDSLLCCQTGSKLADENRFRFHGHEYYLKSPDQMYDLFSDLPEACDNTLAIAEKCNVEIDFNTLHLPNFPIPEGYIDDVDYLADLTLKGIQKRYPNITDEVWDRVAYELSVIQSMGLASYFLICWDLIKFAKEQDILTGPGRGSSAGSIVCYALGVTKIDPLKHNLIFERFINPERIALADIDIDVASWGRDNLINYTKQKYGDEFVAQIVTFTLCEKD